MILKHTSYRYSIMTAAERFVLKTGRPSVCYWNQKSESAPASGRGGHQEILHEWTSL